MVAELSSKVKALKFMQRPSGGSASTPRNSTDTTLTRSTTTPSINTPGTPAANPTTLDAKQPHQVITCPSGRQIMVISNELSLPALFSLDQQVIQEQVLRNKLKKIEKAGGGGGGSSTDNNYASITTMTRRRYEAGSDKKDKNSSSCSMDVDEEEELPTGQRRYRLQTGEENTGAALDDEDEDYKYMNDEGPFTSQDDTDNNNPSSERQFLGGSGDVHHRVPGSSMQYKRPNKTPRSSYSPDPKHN